MSSTKPGHSISPFDDGELYDVIFTGFDYGVDFYVNLARQAQGPVLDMACGTGRILIPCLQAGADIDGLDLSGPMLERARSKAADFGLRTTLYQADMSNFQLPRRYALIMITFNAFIHNLTQEAQIDCLQSCRNHLLPGGLLVFDTFFPGLPIIGAVDNTRVLELEVKHPTSGLPLRMYDTRSFDRVRQTQHSINELELIQLDGRIDILQRAEFTTRWIYKEEMQLLLRVAGFKSWEIHGGFDGRTLKNETDFMVVWARL